MERPGKIVVMPPVDRDVTGVRRVEAHDHPHRRRLARAVRAEEARYDAGAYAEAELVHGKLGTVMLGQALGLDHGRAFIVAGGMISPSGVHLAERRPALATVAPLQSSAGRLRL